MKFILLAAVIIIFTFNVCGQYAGTTFTGLQEKFQSKFSTVSKSSLFLFTNSSIYTPGEYIWASVYCFGKGFSDTVTNVVFMSLVDRYNKKVILSSRFASQAGIGAGTIFLPDSISDGEYVLQVYFDRYLTDKSEPVFFKDIFVRSNRDSPYRILPFDRAKPKALSEDTLHLDYLVSSRKGLGAGLEVGYLLYADSSLQQRGIKKVNKKGELHFTAPIKKEDVFKKWNLVLNAVGDTSSKIVVFPISNEVISSNKKRILKIEESDLRDSIFVAVRSVPPMEKYFLIIYNIQGVLFNSSFYLETTSAVLKLPIDSFPAGHLHAALFKEDGEQLDDISFLSASSVTHVSLESDSTVYHTRSLVKVKVKCMGNFDNAVRGGFSFSCVFKKRIIDNNRHIGDYFYPDFSPMLTSAKPEANGHFEGQVFHFGKRISIPLNLIILNGLRIKTLTTDYHGHFDLPADMLLAEPDKSLLISVTDHVTGGYSLDIAEPDKAVNARLAAHYFPLEKDPSSLVAKDIFSEQEIQHEKNTLKEAVVIANNDDYDREIVFSPEDAPCGVWVCSCEHWKCLACPPQLVPIKGKKYYDKENGKFVRYFGCDEATKNPYTRKIKGISIPKEFPVSDYKYSNDQELSSTLYWNPYVSLDQNGEATLSFYTNDLKGKFSVLIEGVSSAGPLMGSISFDVK